MKKQTPGDINLETSWPALKTPFWQALPVPGYFSDQTMCGLNDGPTPQNTIKIKQVEIGHIKYSLRISCKTTV